MEFQGPDAADFVNAHSLNFAYLGLARRFPGRLDLPELTEAQLVALDEQCLRRLSRSPFLLFSLSEFDWRRWQKLFDGDYAPDLLAGINPVPEPVVRLATAALGFMWQLSKRNSYAARVLSGAPLEWCERLAECTVLDATRFVADEPGLLRLRCADNGMFWQRLLDAGTSGEREVRRAARLCALQTILTSQPEDGYRRTANAACSMPLPLQRVADRGCHSAPQQSTVSAMSQHGYNTRPDESALNKKPHQKL